MLSQIAIDGFSGVGKSVISKKLAEKLGFLYINTGLFFRSITYYYLENFEGEKDENSINVMIEELSKKLLFTFQGQDVYLNNKNISKYLFTKKINQSVGLIASNREVRKYILKIEYALAEKNNVVMEGRDICTEVLKDAQLKIFLNAKVQTRAERRYKQLQEKDACENLTFEEVKKNIENRDLIDSKRSCCPLVKAKDAIEIYTDDLQIDEVVEKIYNLFLKTVAV